MINYLLFDSLSSKVRLREAEDTVKFWEIMIHTLINTSSVNQCLELYETRYKSFRNSRLISDYYQPDGDFSIIFISPTFDYKSVNRDNIIFGLDNIVRPLVAGTEVRGSAVVVGGGVSDVQSLTPKSEALFLNAFKEKEIYFGNSAYQGKTYHD